MQIFTSHILQNKIKQKSFFDILTNNYYIQIKKCFFTGRIKSILNIVTEHNAKKNSLNFYKNVKSIIIIPRYKRNDEKFR